jgi:Spy/CpxP family protein refolding chaperone
MAKGPPRKRDDITDPHEVLIAEVAAAREQLRALIETMKIERLEWERRLLMLQRSPRLTPEQKEKLQQRRRPSD